MNASEVKAALRRRHPATSMMGSRVIPGPWTVVEELFEIDLLAIAATGHAQPASRQVRYPIVGYEVKVSRGDMRTELLRPSKRALGRARCHEFYFAVPRGLLKPEEIAYVEPEWAAEDWRGERCPGVGSSLCVPRKRGTKTHFVRVPVPVTSGYFRDWTTVLCPTCGGKGELERSRVRREAPTLWIPRDVGLIEVTGRGCRVIKPSPVIVEPAPMGELGALARWISVRPDPRHSCFWKAA